MQHWKASQRVGRYLYGMRTNRKAHPLKMKTCFADVWLQDALETTCSSLYQKAFSYVEVCRSGTAQPEPG